jgi:hypothetical protein
MCGKVMESAHVHAAGPKAFMTGAPLATEEDFQRLLEVVMSLPEAPAPEPPVLDPTDPMYPSTVGLELVKRQGKTNEELEQESREWFARKENQHLMFDEPPKRTAQVMETLAGVPGAVIGIVGMAVEGRLGPLVFMLTWTAVVLLWMTAFWWSMTRGPGWAAIALLGLPVGVFLISVAADLLSGRGNDIGPEDWGP